MLAYLSFFIKNAFRLFFFFSPVLSPFSSGGVGRKPLGKKVRAEVQGRRYLGEELPFHFLHFLSSFAFHSRSPLLKYLVATSQGRSPHPSYPSSPPSPRLRGTIQVNLIQVLLLICFFASFILYRISSFLNSFSHNISTLVPFFALLLDYFLLIVPTVFSLCFQHFPTSF